MNTILCSICKIAQSILYKSENPVLFDFNSKVNTVFRIKIIFKTNSSVTENTD